MKKQVVIDIPKMIKCILHVAFSEISWSGNKGPSAVRKQQTLGYMYNLYMASYVLWGKYLGSALVLITCRKRYKSLPLTTYQLAVLPKFFLVSASDHVVFAVGKYFICCVLMRRLAWEPLKLYNGGWILITRIYKNLYYGLSNFVNNFFIWLWRSYSESLLFS